MKASLSSDWFDCCPSNSNLIRRWCNRITFLSQASSSLDTLLHRAKSGENRYKSLNTIKERRVPVGEKKYLSARVDVLALNFGPSDRRKRVGFLRLQRRNPEKDECDHHHRRNGRKNEKKRKMFVSFHSFLLLPLGPTPFQSFETFLNGVSLHFTWILQADFFLPRLTLFDRNQHWDGDRVQIFRQPMKSGYHRVRESGQSIAGIIWRMIRKRETKNGNGSFAFGETRGKCGGREGATDVEWWRATPASAALSPSPSKTRHSRIPTKSLKDLSAKKINENPLRSFHVAENV